jgi:hypothetical protein
MTGTEMTSQRKETIAIALALIGRVLGAVYSKGHGFEHSIVFYVAGLWAVLAIWVNPSPLLHHSMGEIFQVARRGELPQQTPVSRTLRIGVFALMVLGVLIWIKTGH